MKNEGREIEGEDFTPVTIFKDWCIKVPIYLSIAVYFGICIYCLLFI